MTNFGLQILLVSFLISLTTGAQNVSIMDSLHKCENNGLQDLMGWSPIIDMPQYQTIIGIQSYRNRQSNVIIFSDGKNELLFDQDNCIWLNGKEIKGNEVIEAIEIIAVQNNFGFGTHWSDNPKMTHGGAITCARTFQCGFSSRVLPDDYSWLFAAGVTQLYESDGQIYLNDAHICKGNTLVSDRFRCFQLR